jgi:hypothetical protein
MATRTRSVAKREADLLVIADLHFQGESQEAIAGQLGISRQQVGYDLRELERRWREASLREVDEAKARELARIDDLERKYRREWEASRAEKQSTVTESVTGGPGANTRNRARIAKEQRLGNASYLAGVQWCIEQRCKILGIIAPTKVALVRDDEIRRIADERGLNPVEIAELAEQIANGKA